MKEEGHPGVKRLMVNRGTDAIKCVKRPPRLIEKDDGQEKLVVLAFF